MMTRSLVCSLFLGCASLVSALQAAPAWRVVTNDFIEKSPAVAEVHSSSVVESEPGVFVATWFGGTKESDDDVEIWISRNAGNGWSEAVSVADGVQADGKRHPTWNPVLHATQDGRLILFFKVGPTPETWWGEAMISHDGGLTWGERRRLPKDIIGPVKNKAVRLADGRLLCPTATEYDAKNWVIRFETTDEALSFWETTPDIADPKKFGSIQPTILTHPDGRLQALSRSSNREISQTWSTDGGRTWSPLASTGIYVPNSGIDALTLKQGGFLLVYNPSEKTANPKSWGVRCPLVVDYSADGKTWERVATLETKPVRNGFAYPAIIQAEDGRVHLTYTWNRARIKHVVLTDK